MITLGTDGFGRSDDRTALRRHFEVSAEHIVVAALAVLGREKAIDRRLVQKAIKELEIDSEAVNPLCA